MDESDIKIYLKAKKETTIVNIFIALAMACTTLIIVLDAMSVEHEYTIILAAINTVCLLAAMGSGRWISVTRLELLSLIKRQIDNNSKSLKTLSKLGSGGA